MPDHNKESLSKLGRAELRRTAIDVLGLSNAQATNTKSAELIKMIMDAQEGDGKKNGSKGKTPAPRGRRAAAKPASEPEVEVEPTPEPEEPVEGEEGGADLPVDEIMVQLDAIGKVADNSLSMNEAIMEELRDIHKGIYVLLGLAADAYGATNEPDALDGRIEELEQEFDQGNA